jgi:hypothetical protein
MRISVVFVNADAGKYSDRDGNVAAVFSSMRERVQNAGFPGNDPGNSASI